EPMTNSAVKPKSKHATWAWMLWDWAEQPYPTIMQTFIFPVYLAGAVASIDQKADQAIGWATAISGVILALIAPVLGRRSDENGRRKFWLVANTYILVAITAASFFVEPKPEFFLFGLVLYGLGSVIQESAFINYYAMLKQVTKDSNIGKISGFAWGLGYVGGIILLMVSLVGFVLPDVPWFGIPNQDSLNIRSIFLFSAVWILVFSIPMILFVPEIEKRATGPKESVVESYKKVWQQLQTLRNQAPETFKFLISSAIYRDGLAGVFTFGAVLGTLAFGFDQTSIIFFGVAANIVSGLGAAIGGILDDRIGSRTVIVASLMGLIVAGVCVFAFAGMGQTAYWIFGLMLCLFVGPAQASSRTFVSRFTPAGREGEVFGLYQLTGRAVSFLSGTFWSVSIAAAVALKVSGNTTIYGIWGLIVILAVGLALLLRVHPNPKVLD
ncbi:MAG: MFS transporter, partial [Microbacteriaceae bacterium]|nr:MFS transporter [Microbacteriaceae bacterium]